MSSSFQWDWPQTEGGARMTVQVTVGMRTARDLRSMLLDAAYALTGSEQKAFLGLLFKSRFSSRRLRQEMAQFQAVVREDVGQRVHLLALESPSDLRHALPSSLHALELDELQIRVAEALSGKPKTSSREAVVGVLLHRWINQLAPVKVPELAALSGASTPTVYAALTALDPACLQRDEDRRLSLSGFSATAWQRWLTTSTDSPRAKFTDRSGSPRSPDKLARQLLKLGRQDVAIGGVLGAKHHFPGLDITAAPYLDVVVHGTQHTDLSFIGQLDPGLVRDDSAAAHGHVIVHFVNRPHSLFEMAEGAVWANVLDCLVNLWDADLTHQVEHLINHIAPGGLREPLGD
jgi:hypothetical protein